MTTTRTSPAWERYAWVAGILFVLAVVAESAAGLGVGINQNDSAAKIATELADHIPDPEMKAAMRKFYEGTAIAADSFASMVIFAMSQPDDVDVNEILFRPTAQEY